GDETFERSKDFAIRDSLGQTVKQIEHALDRLVEGRYGVCEICGKSIAPERLEAVPWATECMDCRKKNEAHDTVSTRPVEEDVLGVPFARTWTDGHDTTAYDGEDALQEATRYGTSETNQDYPGSHGPDDCFDDADELHGVVFPEEAYVAQDIEGHEFQMDPESGRRRKNKSVKETR
ncbi:MAG: TraR/DksA C4-type zinc finger protein, partial [Bacillota bacterium]